MSDFRLPPSRSPYAGHPWDDPSSDDSQDEAERLFRLWANAVKALQQPGADFDARKAEQAAWSGIREHIAELIERAQVTEYRVEELEKQAVTHVSEAEYQTDRAELAEHRIEELEAALERYGQHDARCKRGISDPYPCVCGFDAVLAVKQ